jgi:ABC-2 type transport system ATP-binding protein
MVGLDPRSARIVKDVLREEVARGTTVFMSTHSLAVAEEIADRIGIICDGRLERLGALDEILGGGDGRHASLEEMFLSVTRSERESGGGGAGDSEAGNGAE